MTANKLLNKVALLLEEAAERRPALAVGPELDVRHRFACGEPMWQRATVIDAVGEQRLVETDGIDHVFSAAIVGLGLESLGIRIAVGVHHR